MSQTAKKIESLIAETLQLVNSLGDPSSDVAAALKDAVTVLLCALHHETRGRYKAPIQRRD